MATQIQIPEDAQYQFDPATNLATITIEVGSGLPGQVEYAHVTARLSVFDEAEGGLTAKYVSHEGDATAEEIDYACRAIETNDLGV